MILQSLMALAEREGLVANPDYEFRELHWRLSVTPQGDVVGLESLLEESPARKGARPRGRTVPIPRPFPGARPSGVTPDASFLVGNASFALGLDLSVEQKYARRPGELQRRIEQFSGLIAEAAESIDDQGLVAVSALFSSPAQLDHARAAVSDAARDQLLHINHLISFGLVGDDQPYIHQRPAVVRYWSSVRSRVVSAPTRQCLVTGIVGPVVDKHPPIRKLPGGTPSGVAIVSFNCPAFESYGFQRNDNAPVSRRAAEGYTAALNRLLDPSVPDPRDPDVQLPEQRVRLSDDTVAVFWSDQPTRVTAAIAPAVARGDRRAIRALGVALDMDESYDVLETVALPDVSIAAPYQDPWEGITQQQLEDPGAFRVLILSGGQGRATIRAFYTGQVRATVKAVREWFRDIGIWTLSGPPALYRLLRTLADRGDQKKLSPELVAEVLLAILVGRVLPLSVLEAAVRQCRYDPGDLRHGRVPAERAALLKAYLNRARPQLSAQRIYYEEVTLVMNERERNKGYLLGRMLACIERMQEHALGEVRASVANRNFAAACATPQAVFPRLFKTEVHHYRKAAEGDRTGSARWLHGQISRMATWLVGHENGMADDESLDALLHRLAGRPVAGFPAFLPLPEQGLFVLGYHQQRAELSKRREHAFHPGGATAPPPSEDRDA